MLSTIKKVSFAVLVNSFAFSVAFAQCPSVPAMPACPSSGTTVMALNGGSTKLDLGKKYVMSGTSYAANNMDQSGSGSGTATIYICSGQTITINQVNTNSNFTYYVFQGGTLNLDGNFNGSTFYIYGTVNYTGSIDFSYQTNGQEVYIGRTGYLNLAGKTLIMNSSGGLLVNEGFIYAGSLKANNGQMCINNFGCTQIDNIEVNDVTNYMVNDAGSGYVFYNNTTKPTVNRNLTASSTLKVCTKQSATWSYWNNASTAYACSTPNWSCSNPLFVSLTFFKAQRAENGVKVSWGTNLQRNTSHFLIERSTNGYTWEEVGNVPAKGDKTIYTEYTWVDNSPQYGTNYYRLIEVENSGATKVYAVDLVTISTDLIPFYVYPNPSNGTFTVYLGDAFSAYEVEFMDLAGKSREKQLLAAGKNELTLNLPTGTYFVKVKMGTDVKIQRISIQ